MSYIEKRILVDKLWRLCCFKKWGRRCEVCDKPASEVHHFFSRRLFSHLRYNLENGVPICLDCHAKHHHGGDKTIHRAIVLKRGEDWHCKLKKKSLERKHSFINNDWYGQNIERLQGY